MNEHIHNEPMQQPGTVPSAQGTGVREMAQGVAERGKEMVRESKDKFRAKAEEMKAKAGELGAEAKERGREYVETQKNRAADRIEGYGGTIREASERLEREQDPNIAHYTRLVAEKLEQAAEYVRHSDVRNFRRDAQMMARRHPAVFFGGMFLAGLAVARLVKASAENLEDYRYDQYEGVGAEEEVPSQQETYASHPSAVI